MKVMQGRALPRGLPDLCGHTVRHSPVNPSETGQDRKARILDPSHDVRCGEVLQNQKVPEDVAKPRQGLQSGFRDLRPNRLNGSRFLMDDRVTVRNNWEDLDSRGHGGKRISMGPMGSSFLSKLCIRGLCDLR